MGSFKRFSEEKLPDKECFYSSVKYSDTGKKIDGYVNDQDCLTCKKFGINSTWK